MNKQTYAPEQNPYTIPIAMKAPFVVANGQRQVTTAHERVSGPRTVIAPNLSLKLPDAIRPKLDMAFAMETR